MHFRMWLLCPVPLKAVATKNGKIVAQQEIETAGEAKSIKLTLHTGPQGLQADGSDAAFIDFEVVDAKGHRCPTDEDRVDFAVSGPVVWRGGFNAAKLNTTNNLYLDTECGINRVAGPFNAYAGNHHILLQQERTCRRFVKDRSKKVDIVGGLMTDQPKHYPAWLC